MVEKIYETKFEYYITRNGFYKIAKIRNGIKNILRTRTKEIKYENSNGNNVFFKRNYYSFAVGYAQSNKNIKKIKEHNPEFKGFDKGLIILNIRTETKLSNDEKGKIKKLLKGKSDKLKREKGRQKKSKEKIFENRLEVVVVEYENEISYYGKEFVVNRSSPIYLKELELGNKDEVTLLKLEENFRNAIFNRYKEKIEVKIDKFNNDKNNLAFVSHYKESKYKNNQKFENILNEKLKEKKILDEGHQNKIKLQQIKNRMTDKIKQTNISGICNFEIKLIDVSDKTLKQILLEGFGGKGGIGMGYLYSKK